MDPPLVAFANICILGVIFGLFASIVDCQEQWPQPVFSSPPPPNQSSLPPPPPLFISPPPPQPFWLGPPPPPPPVLPPQPPVAPPPSASPPRGRPIVSAPPPNRAEDTRPPARKNNVSFRTNIAKIIGWMFLGFAIIMQVLVVIFLVIKQRQLFNPDNV